MKADEAVPFAIQVVAAHLTTTPTPADDLPALLRRIHATVMGLSDNEPDVAEAEPELVHPAASSTITQKARVALTVARDHLACLECGAHVKLLKPHLRDRHGLTMETYINKWDLPSDYPTSPAAYRERKRVIALEQDLGATGRARKAEKRGQRVMAFGDTDGVVKKRLTAGKPVSLSIATGEDAPRPRGRPRKTG